jgi:hypothetical protein
VTVTRETLLQRARPGSCPRITADRKGSLSFQRSSRDRRTPQSCPTAAMASDVRAVLSKEYEGGTK